MLDGGAQRLGLLGDLLRHEVLEDALAGDVAGFGHGGGLLVDALAGDGGVGSAAVGEAHHLAVLEEDDAAGVLQQRRQVAGHEHRAVAVADDDAAGVGDAGRDQHARLLAPHRHDGGGALEAGDRALGRLFEVAAVRDALGDEVGDDLGVGLGAEAVAAGDELGAQLAVVLDDAVVDDDDVAGGVGVGVGVGAGCLAVGGPARVADGGATGRRHAFERRRAGWPACRCL